MKRKRRRKHGRVIQFKTRNGVELAIEYKGLDFEKDRAIRKALGRWDDGSGFLFSDRTRDFSATVPPDKLKGVVTKLKKIRGLTIKKLVQKWVRIR